MNAKTITTYEEAQDYIDNIVDFLIPELEVSDRSTPSKIESALYSISLYGAHGGLSFEGKGRKFFVEFATEYFDNK